MKKYLQINFTRNLTNREKEELRANFQGCYFNLSEALKNGFRVLVKFQNSDSTDYVIKKYSKYGCTFEAV